MRVLPTATEQEAVLGDGAQAVSIDEAQAAIFLASASGPTGATGRVAGRVVGGHSKRADFENGPVFEGPDFGFDLRRGDDGPELRVVAGNHAFHHGIGRPGTGRHTGTTEALEFGEAAAVVEMNVGVQDELDILDTKTERPDVFHDTGDRFGQRGVDQDMALGGSDQNRTKAVGPHVECVAEESKAGLGDVPSWAT